MNKIFTTSGLLGCKSYLKVFFFIFLFALPLFVFGQGNQPQPIFIDDTRNITEVIKALQGPGTEITNITHSLQGQLKPMGYFEDRGDKLELKKGLVITTGSAQSAIGPNNVPNTSIGSFIIRTDPDLATITNGNFHDIAIVEFDIKMGYSKFRFNYVFGSEEYPEFVMNPTFNDAFGFFISGPGINGKKNLATLDNGDAVSIQKINHLTNAANYVSNGVGDKPNENYYLQYDGFTTKLVASTDVIPNEIYHIKMVIADVGDRNWDSGVFIEQESLSSDIPYEVKISYDNDAIDYSIEDCNKAYLTIERDAVYGADPLELDIAFTGSADNGNDFPFVQPGLVTLLPGQLTSVIEIAPFADAVTEGDENLITRVVSTMSGRLVTKEIKISDGLHHVIDEVTICSATPTVINKNPDADFEFNWAQDNALSCQQCPSPEATLTQNTVFQVEVTHLPSGCRGDNTASVLVHTVPDPFNEEIICHNTATAINKNASNSNVYRWGDNQGLSCLNCPSPAITVVQDVTLTVEVEEVATGCKINSELDLKVFNFDYTFDDTSVCEDRPTPINENPLPGYAFTWQPHPSLSCINCASPAVLLSLGSQVTLQSKVRELANGCEITKDVPLTVMDVEEYTIPDSYVCKDEQNAINVSGSDHFLYHWKAHPTMSCTDCQSPTVKIDKVTTFLVQTEEIRTGCKTETQALVRVNAVDYQIPSLTVCANEPTIINGNAPAPYTFQWEPESSLSCTSCASPAVKASQDVQLYVQVGDPRIGCHTKLTVPVHAKKVEAHFTAQVIDHYTSIVAEFKNQSIGANEYRWSFGDGDHSTDFEHTKEYDPLGETMEVQLTAINNQGLYCESTSRFTIFVHEPVFMPNVITPNGDPFNQAFKVQGIETGVWLFTVFNNWGKEIYSAKGYQNNWQAENISSGVYYYELQNPNDEKSFRGWLHVIK
jgi:CHU_C Type IX secretion signal domain